MESREKNCKVEATGVSRATDRRVLRTRLAIREAFRKLVLSCGYDKVTIAAIAREANIDRKTFYLHYESVDAVLDEIACEEAENLVGVFREETFRLGEGVDVNDLFARMSVVLVRNFVESSEAARDVPPEKVLTDKVLKKIEQSLVRAIVEDDRLGLASATGPYLGYCVSFFCAGLVAAYRDWLKDDSEIPLEDLAKVTTTAILSGVEGLLRKK